MSGVCRPTPPLALARFLSPKISYIIISFFENMESNGIVENPQRLFAYMVFRRLPRASLGSLAMFVAASIMQSHTYWLATSTSTCIARARAASSVAACAADLADCEDTEVEALASMLVSMLVSQRPGATDFDAMLLPPMLASCRRRLLRSPSDRPRESPRACVSSFSTKMQTERHPIQMPTWPQSAESHRSGR